MMKGLQILLAAMVVVATLLGAGEVLVAQEEWSVGDTTSFYYFDFHFFRRYERTSMTLRGMGDHCYIWTQNSQWARGRYVDSTGVVTDSLLYPNEPDSVRIDMETVETIIEAFDVSTPAADSDTTVEDLLRDTGGIYDKLTDLYGVPPDVDGDPRIHILIIDCTEDIGYAAMPGYFDPANQLTRIENPYSNYREMFYIDCDPFDPATQLGLGSVAQQFTHLIQYGNDQEEECWITEGLSYFAEFICGYGVANEGQSYSRNYLEVYLQSLMTNCREQAEVQDQAKTTMLMQYIFEQYGLDVIETLARDRNNSGREAITAALAENGFSEVDFDSLFYDEQLAWFMDSPQEDFYGGKYSYKDRYYKSGPMLDAKTYTTWCKLDTPPYYYPGNQWSMDWLLVNWPAPCLGNTMVFKGDVGHNYRVTAIMSDIDTVIGWKEPFDADGVVSMQILDLDDKNRATFDVSGYGETYTMIYVSVLHKEALDGSQTSRTLFVVDNDLTPPEELHLGLFQNPLADMYLSIYIAANESLFVENYLDQRPLLEVIRSDESDTLIDIDRFAMIEGLETDTTWENTIIYLREYTLPGEGDFQIRVNGWDMAGNQAPADEISGAVKIATANRDVTLATQDGKASLRVPAGAFIKDTYVTLFPAKPFPGHIGNSGVGKTLAGAGMIASKLEGGTRVGSPYQLGPSGRTLSQQAKLKLRYTDQEVASIDESQLAIYRLENDQCVPVESQVDPEGNEISAWIDRLGQFQIGTGLRTRGTVVPQTYALLQNYPNPFNPETDIRYQIPSTHERQYINVDLTVYNVLGQKIQTLVHESQSSGEYSVRWNGRDDKGQTVPSGIYFYRIEAGQFESTRRMVLLK